MPSWRDLKYYDELGAESEREIGRIAQDHARLAKVVHRKRGLEGVRIVEREKLWLVVSLLLGEVLYPKNGD